MLQTEATREPKIYIPLSGMFRVCETNPFYNILPGGRPGPGWIFVSNELEIEDASELRDKYEKENPSLTYTVVPV